MDSAMISQPFTHRAWWPIRFSFHLPCALVVFVPRGQSVGLTQGFEHRGLLTVCRLHSWYHFSKLSEDVSLWNRHMLTRVEATTPGQHRTFLSRRVQKQFLKRPSVNWTVLGSICLLVSFWGSTCVFDSVDTEIIVSGGCLPSPCLWRSWCASIWPCTLTPLLASISRL